MGQNPILIEEVYRSNRRNCSHRVLVLEAAGIPCQVRHHSGEFVIGVPSSFAAQARAEIDAYTREVQDSPSTPRKVVKQHSGWAGVLGYAGVVTLIFVCQQKGIVSDQWFDAGKADAELIGNGEWWRTMTALSLHSNLKHLVSNIAFGGLFGLFVGQLLGSGLAWISILLAGAAGNLLNAWIRGTGHTSVGASTSVFAALGIVAALASVRRLHLRPSKFVRYAPVIGAVILLSYLGTSGERTDVFAHVAGFLAGLLLGTVYGRLGDRLVIGKQAQFLCGIGAVAALGATWVIALMRYVP